MNRSVGRSRDLAVLVVAYRAPEKLLKCLQSLAEHLPNSPIHVWDNSGPDYDAVRKMAAGWPSVNWHLDSENLGFAAAVNRLVDKVPDNDFLLFNPDAELTSPLPLTRAALAAAHTAAAAPIVVDFDGVDPDAPRPRFSRRLAPWDAAHRRLTLMNALFSATSLGPLLRGTPLSNLYRRRPSAVDGYLTGACLAVSRDAWDELGPFDDEFFLYGEEADWQWRARRAGWKLSLANELGARHGAQGTVSGDSAGSARSSDLLQANIAMQLEKQRGPAAANAFLAGTCFIESVKRGLRRDGLPKLSSPAVIVTIMRSSDPGLSELLVNVAIEFAARGCDVTVVSLERLGSLPRSVPMSVRLLRRTWWWPSLPHHSDLSVLVTGPSRQERRFAGLWKHRNGRATVIVGSSAGESERRLSVHGTGPHVDEVASVFRSIDGAQDAATPDFTADHSHREQG